MVTKGQRRFMPREKFEKYNDEYDLQMVSSQVFNNETFPSMQMIFWDRKQLEVELIKYSGDAMGFFKKDNQDVLAYIPTIKAKLEEIEKRFEVYKNNRVNQGYAEPTEYPLDLLNQKFIWEARLDVREKELQELQKRLNTLYTQPEQKKEEENILAHGLKLSGKLTDGILTEIDGQKVIRHNGQLIIENGPFRGMAVSDYRKLAESWQKQIREEAQQELIKIQEIAKQRGLPVPSNAPMRIGKVQRADLPEYPKDFKNYFENIETENSESST